MEGSELKPLDATLFGPILTSDVTGAQLLPRQVVRMKMSLPALDWFKKKLVDVEANATKPPFELIEGPAVVSVGGPTAQFCPHTPWLACAPK